MKHFAAFAALFVAAACSMNGNNRTTPGDATTNRVANSSRNGTAGAAAVPHYHVARHIPVGGEGGWDYLTVDSASHRLFVSHADRVEVVDVDSGKVVGTIPNTQGVHGIALAPRLRRGFISAGRTSTVTIFDLDSLKTLREVKTTGERPDAILFEPATARVLTFNAGGRNTTLFDAATGEVAGTIALGGKPEFAVADGRGTVFVNIEDTSELVALDAKSMTIARRWPIAPCEEPSGLAIDRASRRLFSVCDKVMAVSDADAGTVVKTLTIGDGPDAAVFDDTAHLAFSSNGADGTLTVVREESPSSFTVVENATTQRGARTMALDERTHHLYLATAQFGPPPAPTPERPHPRPSILPGTFEILDVAP
jgi:DNA-binding beta-propeller fold protein YncE